MGAEEVVEKILADAKAEAEKIKQQAKEKDAAEQTKHAVQLNEYKKQTEALAVKAAKAEKLHLLAAARMNIAKELLAEKRKILDEVFEQAKSLLQNLPDEQYRELTARLMLKAVETGDEEVIVDKNERRIDQQLIDRVNQQLGSSNKDNLKLSKERQDISSGFILKRGKIKTNAALDILINQARKELKIKSAKELFS